MDDPLKKLLDQTGWSYEDVLKRLEQYKNENVLKTSSETNSTDCDKEKISVTNNIVEKDDSFESVTKQNHRKRRISQEVGNESLPEAVLDESTLNISNNQEGDDSKRIRLSCSSETFGSNNDVCDTDIDEIIEIKENVVVNGHTECTELEERDKNVYSIINPIERDKEGISVKSEDCEHNGDSAEPRIMSDPEHTVQNTLAVEEIKILNAIPNEHDSVEHSSVSDEVSSGICESDRLKDVSDVKCENDNNFSQFKTLVKEDDKSSLKVLCCESTIQENKCDNTFSANTSDSMENITKYLNKRRKLSDDSELSVSDLNQSIITNVIIEDSAKQCDNRTIEEISSASDDQLITSDDTDSNKENADVDLNLTEQNKVDSNKNIPYRPIIREETFFEQAKARYFEKVILENSTESLEKNGACELKSKNENSSQACNSVYKSPESELEISEDNSHTRVPEKHSSRLVDVFDTPNQRNSKEHTIKSPDFGVKKSKNILNILTKKLKCDGIEDDQLRESTSNSSSDTRKISEIVLFKKRKSSIQSNCSSELLNCDASSSASNVSKSGASSPSVSNMSKSGRSSPTASNVSKSDASSPAPIVPKSQRSLLAKKESRKFNTDRLSNITKILSEKLGNITKDLDSKDDTEDEEEGGYKPPVPNKRFQFQPYSRIENTQPKDIPVKENLKTASSDSVVLPTAEDLHERIKQKPEIVAIQTKTNETAIKPTKTKDVTKIKGWKKKKFAVEYPVPVDKGKSALNNFLPDLPYDIPCSSTSQTQSVFTSSILDQFLNQNADLNISYEVPRLEAEQTLQQTYTDVQFPKNEQKVTAKRVNIQEKKDKKPKTVAEKRRMEERPVSQVLEDLIVLETPQSKHYTEMLLKLKKRMLSENLPFSRKSIVGCSALTNTESFITYNSRKIKVTSNKQNKVLCNVVYKSVPRYRKPKKLSLLSSLPDKEAMVFHRNEWEAVEKLLPKVYLELTPTIGKRLHPKLKHLIESNETILTRQRVNFALSVLKTTEPVVQKKKFLFRVPFRNNQKAVSLLKRIEPIIQPNPNLEDEKTIQIAVKQVVDKMLDYVDVLDETKDIIREDDTYKSVQHKQIQSKPTKGPKTVESKEFKRTAYEMKRLNCKFVSLSNEEVDAMNRPCTKDHCRLGCVCNSIMGSVSNLLEAHCGLQKCMLRCICKMVPQSSSVFSDGIYYRLQDEATKDLAKVEKEFTQTVIHTNNQLIVVGDSTERKKRVARVPRKYEDYVEQDEEIPKEILQLKPVAPARIVYKNKIFEPCTVKLSKYDFKDIIPFCMIHLLYKCRCCVVAPAETPRELPVCPPAPVVKEKRPVEPVVIDNQEQLSPCKGSFNCEEHTSRSRGIVSSYYNTRNKTKAHLRRIQKTTKSLEKMLNKYLRDNANDILQQFNVDTQNDSSNSDSPCKATMNHADDVLEIIENATQNIKETESPRLALPQVTKIEKEPKIQRRRTKQKDILPKNVTTAEIRTNQIQQSEKEFCMFLAKHNSQVRILPWSVLMSRYENNSFQLWTLNTPNAPVLLTENSKPPSITHCNIKLFEHLPKSFYPSCEIVNYILNRETPFGKCKDQLWVLFLETSKNVWRICGICDKNESSKDFSVSIITLYGRLDEIIKESNNVAKNNVSTNNKNNVIVHGKKTILSTKRHYLPKKLVPDDSFEECIWASIPNASLSKWRIVSLKTPFAHLSFSRCKHTVDYNDIMKAIEVSRSCNQTLALRSQDLIRTYPHRKFGIYCDYQHTDKVFVGPYLTDEEHDLSLLITKNKTLVDCSTLTDGTYIHTGYWYHQEMSTEDQADEDVQFIPDDTAMIDLTTDSDDGCELAAGLETNPLEAPATGKEVGIKEKRYIITNVSAVGYITAAINTTTNYLDIVCPLTGRTKTFVHVDSAIENLQKILIRKFILVPHSFKLEVKMVDKIDSAYKPLDSAILNGYHMVGKFGVKSGSAINVQDLGKFGLSTTEILQVLEQRERKLLLLPLTVLSKMLNVHVPNKAPFVSSLHNIAEAAREEVDRLHNEEAKYIDQTINLQDAKKLLTKKCLQLVVNLPIEERKKEQSKLHATLKSFDSKVSRLINTVNKSSNPRKAEIVCDGIGNVDMKNIMEETQTAKETVPTSVPKPRSIITRTPSNLRTGTLDQSLLIPLSEVNKSLKLINNTILKQKQGPTLLKPNSALSKVFSTTPVLSKINIPGASHASGSSSKAPGFIKLDNNAKLKSPVTVVTLPPSGSAISTVKIGKSTYMKINKGKTSDGSMATLTPVPTADPESNYPNYIALKDGDNLRYFQLKDQGLNKLNKPPKKIILSSALPLPTNTDKKTAK